MAQFSENDGGYIIILALNTLYIFDSDKIKKKEVDISSFNAIHLCITPYKKDSQNLYFFRI